MTDNARQHWLGVAGLFGVLLVSSGFGFYNLSVYVNVFTEELNRSVSSVSVLVSLFFLTGGFAGMYVARLMERLSIRTVMLGGALISGVALALCGVVESLWAIWALFVLFGFGNAGVSIVVSTSLIARWFPGPNRSIALSIASTGLSVGGVVITPLSAYALEQSGVAVVMPWLGAAFFLLVLPVVVLCIREPEDDLPTASDSVPEEGATSIVRQPFFMLHTLSYVLLMAVQVGGIAHLYSRAEEIAGYQTAALCVQLLSGASIVSRFIGGFVLTRISAYGFTVANLLLQTAGVAVLGFADSVTAVTVGAVAFGASVGNLLMLQPLQLAETYGPTALARVFALANAVTLLGVAAGPLLFGLVRDSTSYDSAYVLAAVGSGVALAVLLTAGAAKKRRETG